MPEPRPEEISTIRTLLTDLDLPVVPAGSQTIPA
jgi:hypothetical protein